MKASEGPWSAPFEYPLFMDLVIWFQPLAAQKVEAEEEGCVFPQEQAVAVTWRAERLVSRRDPGLPHAQWSGTVR